jgi:hypothetical protein
MLRRVCCFTLVSIATLAAAEFWDKKPYTRWDDQEIARILVDSPWAKEVIIRFGKKDQYVAPPPPPPPPASVGGMNQPSPNLGGGPLGPMVGRKVQTIPEGATVRIRWESAEPMRQAIARSLFAAGSAQAAEMAAQTPELYRLVIDNIPPYVESARFGSLQSDLLANTTLRVGKRLTLRPSAVQVSANKAGLIVRIDFPRDGITAQDGEVSLETEAGISGIECHFRLRDMLFGGKLAL